MVLVEGGGRSGGQTYCEMIFQAFLKQYFPEVQRKYFAWRVGRGSPSPLPPLCTALLNQNGSPIAHGKLTDKTLLTVATIHNGLEVLVPSLYSV